ELIQQHAQRVALRLLLQCIGRIALGALCNIGRREPTRWVHGERTRCRLGALRMPSRLRWLVGRPRFQRAALDFAQASALNCSSTSASAASQSSTSRPGSKLRPCARKYAATAIICCRSSALARCIGTSLPASAASSRLSSCTRPRRNTLLLLSNVCTAGLRNVSSPAKIDSSITRGLDQDQGTRRRNNASLDQN